MVLGFRLIVPEASSALIMAYEGDLAVPVFLHELTITDIVQVAAFKSFAVLRLLNGLTVALAILIGSLEARAVGIVYNHLAFHLPVHEVALEDITVVLG